MTDKNKSDKKVQRRVKFIPLGEPKGLLLRDGRGWFVPDEDLRELFAFCIEPGMPFPSAPFAGMTADEIADAFAEEAMATEQGSHKVSSKGRS